jgi:hypothetical protein
MDNLLSVLKAVYLRGGVTLQSNFARENAKVVGALASLGYLSTKEEADTFSNTWRPTFAGLLKLTEKGLV